MSTWPKTIWTKITDKFENRNRPTSSDPPGQVPATRTYAFNSDFIVDAGQFGSRTGQTVVISEKPHRPLFTVGVGVFDVFMLLIMYLVQRGLTLTPDTWIKMGGKYVPCMKPLSSEIERKAYEFALKSKCHSFLFPYQIYRFFTPMFLHGGLSHLLNNLVYQALAGTLLERKYGTKTFAICYILFGFSGNVMSALVSPKTGKSSIE